MTTEDGQPFFPDLLTIEEAAFYLGVTTKTMRNWRARGGGPVFTGAEDGKNYRYEKKALELWKDAQRQSGNLRYIYRPAASKRAIRL